MPGYVVTTDSSAHAVFSVLQLLRENGAPIRAARMPTDGVYEVTVGLAPGEVLVLVLRLTGNEISTTGSYLEWDDSDGAPVGLASGRRYFEMVSRLLQGDSS